MRNPSKRNAQHLIHLLEKKLKEVVNEINKKDFFHLMEFSKKKPYLEFTLTISADEFEIECLKEDNEILLKKLNRLQKKYEALGGKD